MPQDCIFCKIANKEIPNKAIYEDDKVMAFNDINPAAPIHILVITKRHIANLTELNEEDKSLMGHVMMVISKVAQEAGLAADGFRVVANTKEHGGQTVPHLHFHILGGRFMEWPPG